MMRIVIGSDHGGFDLKEDIKAYLAELGHECVDYGTHSKEPVDYPDFAFLVAEAVARGLFERGIIVDGAGVGSAMAANKVPGVRCAPCQDIYTARNSREHNDANVLALGDRVIGKGVAREIVKVWLATEFAGGRHLRRVEKIMEIERRFLSRGN
ncbi:MAG TPA: ribose 5-phosphate isomerase B [Firmicutes bacterium]|nr:ribose 5-phosphate isomerase B [Bacillota bacterium]